MRTCDICGKKMVARGLCRNHYVQFRRRGELADREITLGQTPLSERLLSKIEKDPGAGCWNWTAELNGSGYGCLWRDGKRQRAHRISYELFVGPLSSDEVVCHRCDNPRCVNPDHLFKGTRLHNNRDTSQKKRYPIGERHHMTKLSDGDVREILSSSLRTGELALKYGVHQSTISKLRTGARTRATLREDAPG